MASAQEEFWKGGFGDAYTDRCSGDTLIDNNIGFFKRVLRGFRAGSHPATVIEFGANRGLNLLALKNLEWFETSSMTGVEINNKAANALREIDGVRVIEGSALSDGVASQIVPHDLVLSSGFLIHINGVDLHEAYDVIYRSAKPEGHVLLVEYFAATPTPTLYRGHEGMMWRRNYGKDFLMKYIDVTLVDYGFVADIDRNHPKDNVNWWLFQKGRSIGSGE